MNPSFYLNDVFATRGDVLVLLGRSLICVDVSAFGVGVILVLMWCAGGTHESCQQQIDFNAPICPR